MIVAALLVALFVGTILTGPLGQEWLEQRRERRQFGAPRATVVYLPSAACRALDDFARLEYVDPTAI